MNLKAIIYLIVFFQSIICFGQFKHPEPTIVRPTVILPENDINDYSKLYNKKIKKKIIGKTIIEFDINGNVISEINSDSNSTTTILYRYTNNILVEKEKRTTIDTKNIEKRVLDNSNYIKENEKKGEKITVVADYNYNNEFEFYKAILDKKKNRITSYLIEKKEGDTKTSIKKYNIFYNQDKIIEISEDNGEKKQYFYKNNLIDKIEYFHNNDKRKTNSTTYFIYDLNSNLTLIKGVRKTIYNDKISENKFIKDSAVYDNKNNIVWAYNVNDYLAANQNQKNHYITYKYNDNNKIIESTKFENGIEMIKSSYSYENNLLKEIKQIHKGDYILTKNYKYIDGKLVEFTELDPFLNVEKRCVYDYDEFTNLKSITEFRKYTDRKSGKITNVKISTFFSFNNNTLTIKNQNGIIEKYEFFD